MPYVDLDGVASYYEIHGAGAPVLLLHGGYCSIETLSAQIEHLAPTYEVHAPERPGQGRTPDRDGPIGFDDMVSDTLAYLDALSVPAAHLVGFSDGAITGLLLARDHPDRVRSLVAISGNLDPTGFVADDDSGQDAAQDSPEPAEPEELSPFREAYNRLSPDGPEHGDVVLEKLMTMWRSQPQIDPASLASITAPTLVMAGQHDSIRTDHTLEIARSVPGAQVAIVPGASHLVMEERPAVVNLLIAEFLAGVPD
jgi:pimeloyl-ACP methyl ester carboxylesterase